MLNNILRVVGVALFILSLVVLGVICISVMAYGAKDVTALGIKMFYGSIIGMVISVVVLAEVK
jgi:hypothetical protein